MKWAWTIICHLAYVCVCVCLAQHRPMGERKLDQNSGGYIIRNYKQFVRLCNKLY